MRALVLTVALALAAAPAAPAATVQPGDLISIGCTLGWVFDGSRGEVFFASAAHCFDKAGEPVHIAADGPIGAVPGDRLGVVRVLGSAEEPQTDAALIEVDQPMRERVAPEMRGHPQIPSGVAAAPDAAPGDLLQLSGWGVGFSLSEPTRQRRQGVLLSAAEGAWRGLAPVTGGDSGGPVAHVPSGRAFGLVKGYRCGGTNTEIACTTHGPTIAGVEALAAAAGITIRLRRAGEAAPPAPAPQPPSAPPSDPAPAPPAGAGPSCAAPTRRRLMVRRVSLTRSRLELRGRAAGDACAAPLRRVEVAVALRSGRRCRHLTRARLGARRNCGARYVQIPHRPDGSWSLRRRVRLPPGRYIVRVRVTDTAGEVVRARRSVRVG